MFNHGGYKGSHTTLRVIQHTAASSLYLTVKKMKCLNSDRKRKRAGRGARPSAKAKTKKHFIHTSDIVKLNRASMRKCDKSFPQIGDTIEDEEKQNEIPGQ